MYENHSNKIGDKASMSSLMTSTQYSVTEILTSSVKGKEVKRQLGKEGVKESSFICSFV